MKKTLDLISEKYGHALPEAGALEEVALDDAVPDLLADKMDYTGKSVLLDEGTSVSRLEGSSCIRMGLESPSYYSYFAFPRLDGTDSYKVHPAEAEQVVVKFQRALSADGLGLRPKNALFLYPIIMGPKGL